MRRLAALIPAAVALAAGVCCIPAFAASAADVRLSASQTRALFGDTIPGRYYWSPANDYYDCTFEYYGNFTYTYSSDTGYEYSLDGVQGVAYSFNGQHQPSNENISQFTAKINPIIDLSNLNTLQMTFGFTSSYSGVTYGNFYSSSGLYWYKEENGNATLQTTRPISENGGVTPSYYYFNLTDPDTGDVLVSGKRSSCYQINLVNMQNEFSFVMNGSVGDASLTQLGFVDSVITYPAENVIGPLLLITCPYLSDTYHNNGGGSGGGSESSGGGWDGPDYSGQLALILAKLDLIVNNDFNIDIDLESELSGIESRLDGVNSRLDGNNSRLDGNNSRLDGINSRLDGINSRLDNITGELHDLNSAPSETLPNTGGENSEFEHQAEMYMSDFRNEFEDSENQVFEVIDKGTGFLGFVRQFIISSHLAQILPLLALLFIAHYVIFERGG